MVDPTYYTVADGDGQTTTASRANDHVGGHTGPAAERRAPVLHATESDSRQTRLRRTCRRSVPAILRRGRWPPWLATWALLPVAAGRLLRGPGFRAGHRVACGGFVRPT